MKVVRHPILAIAVIVVLNFLIGLATTLWVIGLFLLYFGIARIFFKYIRRAIAIGLFVFIFIHFGWVAAFGFIFLNIGVPLSSRPQSDKHTKELSRPDHPSEADQQAAQATLHKLLDELALQNDVDSGLNKGSEKNDKRVDERDRFDAFTVQARTVLGLAQEEAQRFQHSYIGTEHLLLGLIGEGEGVAAKVLSNFGVRLDKIRSAVEFIIGRGDHIVPGAIGLTPRAKRVIEQAADEARRLNHTYIGTEHLLLGLVSEGESIAAGVLESLGVNLEDVRERTMKVLGLGHETSAQSERQEPVQPFSYTGEQENEEKQEKGLGYTTEKRESSRLEVSPPIRLFISSTFTDFVFERDVLQRAVFPRLRALCAAQGCRFQPIDLRWGVSQEAGNEKRTLAICLEEIARCQRLSPDLNFLVLLGDRYGSCFLPERIPSQQVARLLPHLAPAERARFIQTYTEDQYILLPAYAEDHNALPPEYVLLPAARTKEVRQEENLDLTTTEEVVDADAARTEEMRQEENRLRMALVQAAQRAGFSEQERLPFLASATHLEIQRGLLDTGCDPAATVCAFRMTTGIASGESATGLEVESPEQRAQLEALKLAVERRLDGRVLRYKALNETAGPSTDQSREAREDALAKLFLALLEPRVRDALARRHAAAQMRDPVAEANEQFVAARTSVVIGREVVLEKVASYLTGQTPRPLVATGESGVGKSTLLARAVENAAQRYPHAVIVTRYVGITPGTSSLTALLSGLRHEIAERYGQSVPEPLGDLSQLVAAFANQLRTLKVPAERPLFLFVDALDQLGVKPHRVDWLRNTLSPNIRLVVSTLADREELAILRTWLPSQQILQLEPLTLTQGVDVLRQWLANERRQLTSIQTAAVLDGFASSSEDTKEMGTPLYLRLAFEQARTWRSFNMVDPLPPTVPALIQGYLRRLEKPGQHGQVLVAYALGYIAAAKHGLAEDELLDLLSRSESVRKALHRLGPGSPAIVAQQPLPMALWARLSADLERYLTEREADGARLVTFYHRQVHEEVEERYLRKAGRRAARHAELAAYFSDQPYRLSADGAGVWNRRKLAELAYQQAGAGPEAHRELGTTLTDGRFLEGKLTVEGVAATLDDLERAPGDAASSRIASAILAGSAVLTREPAELPNQITGRVGAVECLHHLQERPTAWLRLRSQSLTALDSAQIHILQGHTGSVTGCALSADGQLILSASRDKMLRLWDTATGQCLRVFEGHTKPLSSCALSADGDLALSAEDHFYEGGHFSIGHRLRLWNTATGQCLRVFEGHEKKVASCALSADGRLALSASWDNTLRLWDTSTGQCLRTFEGHTRDVSDCALSVNGRLALSASWDKTLRLWDTANGQCLRVFEGHASHVDSCALSADGRLILSASMDRTLRLWDTSTGQCLRIFEGYTSPVISCALNAEKHLALSSSTFGDLALCLWDTSTGERLRIFEGHAGSVGSCALSKDGRLALTASGDRTLRLWKIAAERSPRELEGRRGPVACCAISADGYLALSTSADNTLRLWNSSTGQHLNVLAGHARSVVSCALSANGGLALSASSDKTLRLWDTAASRCLQVLQGHSREVDDCALSADGRLALSTSWDKLLPLLPFWNTPTLRLWDTATGECLRIIKSHSYRSHCALSADGRLALTASTDYILRPYKLTLMLWDTSTGKVLRVIKGPNVPVEKSCALSADGHFALCALGDRTLRLWDTASGQCLHVLKGHTSEVTYCVLSTDGGLALSTSSDCTLRLWSTVSGQEIARWTHDAALRSCALSRDGRLAVASDALGGVHFLEVVDVAGAENIAAVKQPLSRLAERSQSKPSLLRWPFRRHSV